MKELLRSNDAVLLSYVSALLEEGDIAFMVADSNMCVWKARSASYRGAFW
jgi:hypothetical protein